MATEVEKLIAAVEANTGTAAAQLEGINKLLDKVASNRRGRIKIDVDDRQVTKADKSTKSLNTQLTGLQGTAQKLQGIKLGAKFSELGLAIPTVMSAVSPLIGGINSLGAGAIGLVAPLSTATNLLAGLPGVLLPAAGAFGTFKLATLGVGDAIKESVKLSGELADAMAIGDADKIDAAKAKIDDLTASMEDKFAPAALDFIGMMPLMQVQAQELGKSLQPGLFRGAVDGLRGIESMVRNITPQLGVMSAAMGSALGNLGRQVGSAEFGAKLSTSLSGGAGIVRALTSGLSTLLDVAVDLGAKAQPVLGRIEGSVSRVAAQVRIWADNMTSGKMEAGYETFRKLWSVISNTGSALAGTLRAFKPMGDWLWDSLNRLTMKWKLWTDSITGQDALGKWAEDSKPVLVELGAFLADFGKMWARLSDESGMADIIKSLRQGFLPALEEAIAVANESKLFQKLVDSLGDLLDIVATLAGPSSVLGTLVDGMAVLAEMAANALDSFPMLATVVGNLATAFGLLKLVGSKSPIVMGLTALVVISESLFGSIKPLVPVVTALAAAFAAVKVSQFLGQFGGLGPVLQAPVANLSLMADGLRTNVTQSGALGGALTALNPAVLGVTAVVTAGFMAWQAWSTNVRRVREEAVQLRDAIYDGVPANQAFADSFQNILDTRDSFNESFDKTGLSIKAVTDAVNTHAGDVDKMRAAYTKWQDQGGTFDQYQKEIDSLDPSVQALSDHLVRMSASGKIDGNQWAEANDAMADLAQQSMVTADGLDSQADVFERAAKKAGIYAQVQTKLKAIDNADSVEEKQRLLGELAFTYGDLIDTTGFYIDTTVQEREAMDALNQTFTDGQKKLDAYYAALSKVSSQKDLIKSQEDLIAKSQEIEKTFKENGRTLDMSSEKGRANRDAVRSMYEQFVQLGEGIYKSTGDAQQAQGVYGLFTERLKQMQRDGLLPAGTSAEDLAEQLQLTARTWNADFNLAIQDEQMLKLEYIKTMAETMNDKGTYAAAIQALVSGDTAGFNDIYNKSQDILANPDLKQNYTLTEIRKLVEEGIVPSRMPDGSIYYAGGQTYLIKGGKAVALGATSGGKGGSWENIYGRQADGSVMMGKFANGFLPQQAKIQSPRANLIQWAEPETEGEAFIPLARSKRTRSLAIWHETGRRLGAMANGGMLENQQAIAFYNSLANRSDSTTMKHPAFFVPPSHPAAGVGGGGGKGGSFQTIIDYINSLGIPFRNMGTWAFRNVLGTNRLSLHASGRAVDLGDPNGLSDSAQLLRIYLALKSAPFKLSELIYSGPGGSNPRNPTTAATHHNHVHAAMLNGGITPFANGGIVRRPTLGLVGESGPEAVIPLRSFANGGFSAEDDIGRAGEAMSNAWERIVSGLEKSNPAAAIKAIFTRMLNEGMQTYSDGWEQMYSRIESIQQSMADEAKRRTQNKWEWDYERATPERQLALALKAQKGMVEWSDEWVALQRRIEDARAEVKAGGPAVYIAQATFQKEADIDALNRSTSWAIRSQRL